MRRFSKILLLWLPVFGCCSLYAQLGGQARTDSLIREIPNQKTDTDKVNVMLRVAARYVQTVPDEALKYAKDGLALAQKSGWRQGMLHANNRLGSIYAAKGDNKYAMEHYLTCLIIAEEIKDKSAVSGSYMNIGLAYQSQANNPKALDYFFKALKGYEALNDTGKMVGVINNIGNVYYDLKNYPKALDYFSRALKINRRIGNRSWEAFNMNNMANVYNDQNDYAKAIEYYKGAMKINEELLDTPTIGINLVNIGYCALRQRNYSSALPYLYSGLEVANKIGNKQLIGNTLGNLGVTYYGIATDTSSLSIKPDSVLRVGKKTILLRAIKYLEEGIHVLTEVGDLNNLREFTGSLSDAYFSLGDQHHALQWYKQSVALKDSIFNTENNVKITNLETEREVALKDKQIEIDKLAVAKKRNERGFYIMGIVALLGIVVYVARSNKLLGREKQKSEDLY